MSLQLAAQHLASQGRGPDTTLVHMGQGEVEALQGLAHAAGGQLTTNPQTGLPEAGFLSSILPMIAGAGLSLIPGMAPFAPLIVGGITGVATGNIKKGLMAGLGAYGGSSIAGGLGAMGAGGAGAAGATTGAATTGAAAGATGAATAPTATTAATDAASRLHYLVPPPAPVVPAATQAATEAAAPAITQGAAMGPQMPFEAMNPAQRFAAIEKGFTGDNLIKYASDNKFKTAAAFAPMIAGAMAPPKYKEAKEDTDPGQQYNYEANPTDPTPEYDPQGRGRRYFDPRYVNAARGGIMQGVSPSESHLGSYSAGGRGRLLRGPGDGVSDSIPAVIGNKQPARLADGEFVIPARIVSELGNGSTEAGAKQLYAMMDRIQAARRKTTGKKQVAKKTNARKLLPA